MLAERIDNRIHDLESLMSFSRQELAQALQVHRRTIERWIEHGDTPQRNRGGERLDQLETLVQDMENVFGRDRVNTWLETDNGYFGFVKPREVLLTGRFDRIEAALEALKSGAFV